MAAKEKTTMSVMEMGRLLGLKKTDSYWLVHKQCFETTLVQGVMRVNIESFEHWYANQIKRRKVDGSPPGMELRAYSYSIAEMAEILAVPDYVAYDLIKRYHIETFEVDSWKRIRKDVFEAWYKTQTKYRTPENRQRDAELENNSMTLPQMARLLGISREEVYALVSRKSTRDVFEIIIVADKKRVTIDSFERWYQGQNRYQKVTKRTSGLEKGLDRIDDSDRKALLNSDRLSFTVREAALIIGASPREIYRMIEDEILDSFYIGKMVRIRRAALEWWLSSRDNVYGKEEP